MNKRISIKNNTKFYILCFIIISLCIIIFAFKPNTTNVYAANIETTNGDEEVLILNEQVETYTVNFFNGSEGIGTFNISAGEQYLLTQTGYTINGNTYEFTGKHKMNNCAYGDYYGLPLIDNVVVATYGGWSINGEILFNSGTWCDYDNLILDVYAVWNPIDFTIVLNDGYTDNSIQEEVNYFDGITLPSRYREGYEFKGWETSDGYIYQSGTTLNPIEDVELTGKWEELFEVRLISSEHRNYDRTWEGNMGDTFTLPSLNSGYYYVSQWGTYQVGNEYTIIGDATLYAVWKGNTYSITYKNLTFMGQTADVLLDNYLYQYAPTEYEYGVGLDLSRVSAFWQTNSPYSPQLRFLGWYTDAALTTPATSISTTATGAKTFYAKWRYDQDNPSRYGTYTITDSGVMNQSYDQLWTGLTYNNLYSSLNTIGIKYLAITFKINMWEVNDGYQHIYIYDDSDSTVLWSTRIEHGRGSKDGSAKVYAFQIYIPIESIKDDTYLKIRYSASGAFGDTWQNDKIYYEKMYVANESDIYDPEFYWNYQDDFPGVEP